MNKNAQLILDVIANTTEHLTAEQIHMTLRNSGKKMALATVYNNLSQLFHDGLVRKVCVDGYPDRYDQMMRHDHLVCRICGALADIHFQDLTELLQSQTGEEVLSYDLQVSYICPICRRAAHPTETPAP